jgi:hypothetical protein
LLHGVAAVVLVSSLWVRPWEATIMAFAAGLMILCGFCFRSLTIADEGEWLAVRFGPLPFFGTSIRYADISDAQPGRTSWIDGWGIHYLPGRGWTYNLWGFRCVVLRMVNRSIRLGTDDPDNLAHFIRQRIGAPDTVQPDTGAGAVAAGPSAGDAATDP